MDDLHDPSFDGGTVPSGDSASRGKPDPPHEHPLSWPAHWPPRRAPEIQRLFELLNGVLVAMQNLARVWGHVEGSIAYGRGSLPPNLTDHWPGLPPDIKDYRDWGKRRAALAADRGRTHSDPYWRWHDELDELAIHVRLLRSAIDAAYAAVGGVSNDMDDKSKPRPERWTHRLRMNLMGVGGIIDRSLGTDLPVGLGSGVSTRLTGLYSQINMAFNELKHVADDSEEATRSGSASNGAADPYGAEIDAILEGISAPAALSKALHQIHVASCLHGELRTFAESVEHVKRVYLSREAQWMEDPSKPSPTEPPLNLTQQYLSHLEQKANEGLSWTQRAQRALLRGGAKPLDGEDTSKLGTHAEEITAMLDRAQSAFLDVLMGLQRPRMFQPEVMTELLEIGKWAVAKMMAMGTAMSIRAHDQAKAPPSTATPSGSATPEEECPGASELAEAVHRMLEPTLTRAAVGEMASRVAEAVIALEWMCISGQDPSTSLDEAKRRATHAFQALEGLPNAPTRRVAGAIVRLLGVSRAGIVPGVTAYSSEIANQQFLDDWRLLRGWERYLKQEAVMRPASPDRASSKAGGRAPPRKANGLPKRRMGDLVREALTASEPFSGSKSDLAKRVGYTHQASLEHIKGFEAMWCNNEKRLEEQRREAAKRMQSRN